ncbi:DNA-binding transcriptional regulator, MarR family [Sporobacter termitidis DSM 10068]|uniref:DNA-binding transcriptional regulator, MarR family n=1 Tax=Sporobacter termitidis DSM 10068 TaxID=1123282 RepID=A0A1M5WDR8_9FIRM|nr:MarR family transcriptional regulator [Sporobacter termitidis]SHH85374.1 DNA-binding transcriptional regulator, MarR family [Sporobacter termitidis DSM 10068]
MDRNDLRDSFPGGGSVPERLYILLLRCSHALSRGHHHELAAHPGQWRVLSFLAANGATAQRELLEAVQIRPASLSELLAKLESKGLITRAKDEDDKRSAVVELTALGRAVIDENAGRQQSFAAELFSPLSAEEQEQLAGLLDKLVQPWHEKYHAGREDAFGHHRDHEEHGFHGGWHGGHGFHGAHGHHGEPGGRGFGHEDYGFHGGHWRPAD